MFLSDKAPINWFKVYPYKFMNKQPNKQPNNKVTFILNIVDNFVIDFLAQLNKIYAALLSP